MAKKMKTKSYAKSIPKKGVKGSKKPLPSKFENTPKSSPSVPGSKADAALSSLTKGKR